MGVLYHRVRIDALFSKDVPCTSSMCHAMLQFDFLLICKEHDRPSLWFYRDLGDRKMQKPNLDHNFLVLIGYKILILLLHSVDESQFQPRRSISTYKHSLRSQDFLPLLQLWPILFLR